MAWVWTGGTNLLHAQSGPDSQPGPAVAVDRIQRCFRAVEAIRRDIPRESFDISAVAASLDNNPAVIMAWVHDHTAWVPYHGTLRGPLGVLMDRRGNSFDRAMLLAELLRAGGKTVRLAHAELPEPSAMKLSQELKFIPKQPLAESQHPDRGGIDRIVKDYAEPFGLNVTNFRRAAEDRITQSQRITEDLVSRSVQQSSTLTAMILNLKPGTAPSKQEGAAVKDTQTRLIDSLQDHWWAQLLEGEK